MFEHILIKNMLENSKFFSKVIAIIDPKYFTSIGCSKLIQLIKSHYIEYKIIPTMTEIVAMIKDVPNQETRKNIVQELQQISKAGVIDNNEFLLKSTTTFIKDAIFTEALILGSDALTEKNEEKILKSKQLMDEMSKISLTGSDLGLDFSDIETMIEYYQKKEIGVRTIHDSINKRIGSGFLPGTLSIILAAAGIGKCSKKSDCINIYVDENQYTKIESELNKIRKNKI